MKTIIIGGDERFSCLARLLRQAGVEAEGFTGEATLADAALVVANCPPKSITLEALLRRMPKGAKLALCGPRHPEIGDGRVVDLWADEALLWENAQLTAEGAVCAAMRASTRALRDMRCAVVGWGRVGRALTELLVGMGARVTVFSGSEAKRNRAVERGAEAVPTAMLPQALPGHRLIFNTAPAMVLDGAALESVDPDAMLIDLASAPYGIDLNAAWRRSLRAWREPGLPGRHCPQSAAASILRALRRNHLIGGNGDE